MKIQIKTLILGWLCIAWLPSCVEEKMFDNTPHGNFEALWKIIDEQYCFLDSKNIDWDDIHRQYQKRISANMSSDALFEVLGDMLAELKDGHVNLYSAHDVARYWKWFEDYPTNFDEEIQKQYLGTNYKIASGLKYKILEDNVGYIYYENFSSGIGNGNLDEVLLHFSICKGIIIDVRNNGGGMITNAAKLASRFTNQRLLTGFIQHKTGRGHSDFSDPLPIYLDPSNSVRWQKKTVVLTNRHSYSATNDFVSTMKQLPAINNLGDSITIMGDWTGGGGGLPTSSELPNGWSVRFSASPHFDAKMNQIEGGIQPDIRVDMIPLAYNKDAIIECARHLIKE